MRNRGDVELLTDEEEGTNVQLPRQQRMCSSNMTSSLRTWLCTLVKETLSSAVGGALLKVEDFAVVGLRLEDMREEAPLGKTYKYNGYYCYHQG